MSTKTVAQPKTAKIVPMSTKPENLPELLHQYGSNLIRFAGTEGAIYDRHLIFDRAIDPKVASARERFEAFARSVRDVLAQRWVQTKTTYERQNAKRIYYLSMEFLLGRSLANNVTNLLFDPIVQHAVKEKGLNWLELIEQEPDAGLGNGGLGRLAACFLDSMATMQLPATGYGLRYEYGMFRQSFVNGWQQESADNWLRDGDPWEICRQHEKVEIKLSCSFKLRDGKVRGDSESALQPVRNSISIVPWLGTEERQSTLSASGSPVPPTTSIFRNLEREISSVRWLEPSKRNR